MGSAQFAVESTHAGLKWHDSSVLYSGLSAAAVAYTYASAIRSVRHMSRTEAFSSLCLPPDAPAATAHQPDCPYQYLYGARIA